MVGCTDNTTIVIKLSLQSENLSAEWGNVSILSREN